MNAIQSNATANRGMTYHQTALQNENTAIGDLAQGKRSGVIAQSGAKWVDTATTLDGKPVETDSPNQVEYQTTLKGEWQGQGRERSSFNPTELVFESSEKAKRVDLRQKVTMGLASPKVSPLFPGIERFQTPSQLNLNRPLGQNVQMQRVKAELGLTIKDREGNALIDLNHAQTFVDGTTSHETRATIQATKDLELTGSYTQEDCGTAGSTLGATYAPELEVHSLSLSGEIQNSHTQSDRTQGLTTTVTLDAFNLNYSRETISQNELIDGIQAKQEQEMINASYALLDGDLSVNLSQQSLTMTNPNYLDSGAVVAGKDRTLNREYGVTYQLTPQTALGFSHGREEITTAALPQDLQASEYSTFHLEHKFNDHWKGQAEYTIKPHVSQLYSGKLSYEEAETEFSGARKWEAGMDVEKSLLDPLLSNRHYQLGYSATRVQDRALAMDCKFSYQSFSAASLTPNQWEGNLKLYGSGKEALPLQAELRVSSNHQDPVGLSLNYYAEF